MITMHERDVLDLYTSRSNELIAAADRHRQSTERHRQGAAPAGDRVSHWRVRLPRWFTLDITLRVTVTVPPGSATRTAR